MQNSLACANNVQMAPQFTGELRSSLLGLINSGTQGQRAYCRLAIHNAGTVNKLLATAEILEGGGQL